MKKFTNVINEAHHEYGHGWGKSKSDGYGGSITSGNGHRKGYKLTASNSRGQDYTGQPDKFHRIDLYHHETRLGTIYHHDDGTYSAKHHDDVSDFQAHPASSRFDRFAHPKDAVKHLIGKQKEYLHRRRGLADWARKGNHAPGDGLRSQAGAHKTDAYHSFKNAQANSLNGGNTHRY